MKKKRKLNLGKSKIASMNTIYSIKGGMTLGCATHNTCPSGVGGECPTEAGIGCVTDEGITTCPTTHTIPASQTCPGGSGTESGNGGTATNLTCSANLPSLNC